MIVTIAGSIASGKSTLARELAKAWRAKMVGFGDYVRVLAQGAGLDASDRKVLQNLGQARVTQSAEEFLADTLDWAGHDPAGRLVLDGLRHIAVWQVLQTRQTCGLERVELIFLDTPQAERVCRAAARGMTANQLAVIDAHPAERDINAALLGAAGLILDGSEPVDLLVAQGLAHLGE